MSGFNPAIVSRRNSPHSQHGQLFMKERLPKTGASHVIETERLLLRRMTPEDADALFAVLGDPVSMKYYPDAFSREDVSRWIAWCIASYTENGYGSTPWC